MSEKGGGDLRDRLRRARSSLRKRSRSRRSGDNRSRSRNRRGSRSGSPRQGGRRSRSGSGLSRSPSRGLYEEDEKIQRIASLVKGQQDFLLDLLTEHKAEVDQRFQIKQRKFASRQIEKQFEINSGFCKLALSAKSAIENNDVRRATACIEELIQQLETHSEDLVIADTSPHGWLAVAKVRAGTDLPKALRKKLEQVDRELSAQKNQYGGSGKKFFGLPKEGQGPLIRRDNRRITAEEALSYASKQLRSGICSHCKKAYHFYRECPDFWQRVQESREEEAKKTNN